MKTTNRKCATPGCDRAPRTSGSDGKTLHAYCVTCEEKVLALMFAPKEASK